MFEQSIREACDILNRGERQAAKTEENFENMLSCSAICFPRRSSISVSKTDKNGRREYAHRSQLPICVIHKEGA